MIMAQMSEFQILCKQGAGEIDSPILLEFSPRNPSKLNFFLSNNPYGGHETSMSEPMFDKK